ncbi:MAG: T9SS type A sorting domain-containing protein [Paludibacteraceae bacterium]|nr:T9SS type A sorting domain-containing protein [Paludibacteraceae bacterium]
MKKKFLLALGLFFSLMTAAQETRTHLVVWAKDGTQVAYALSEQPVIKFSETDLLITTSLIQVSYPLEQMAKFSYEKHETQAVHDISADESVLLLDKEALLFLNLEPNTKIALYSVSGQVVFNRVISAFGEYAFPLSLLPQGTYVVQINNLTYKIVR